MRQWSPLRRRLPRLNYGQKLFLLATLPLLLAVAGIAAVVATQANLLAEREIASLERQLIDAKKRELRNYILLARTAIQEVYGPALPDDEDAKLRATQILSAMVYGQEGFFFVYDYEGKNLVSPRQTWLINRDWSGLSDSQGTPIVDTLITTARQGAGYHSFLWPKPTTGEETQMVAFVIGLQDWRWALGTGIFIDDVIATVNTARAEVRGRVNQTFLWIGTITLAALLLVFVSGLGITARERRLADAKLKELTQRVLDTQEEERGRVARELHDSISQLLVGVRYVLELARRRITQGDNRALENIERGISGLAEAIGEVRRISHDLRPAALDDLGLGPALQALTERFGSRTGISAQIKTVVFRNRLDNEAKIALYRIAQEALTNIERHAGATEVTIDLFGHRSGATMRIQDNGRGLPPVAARTSTAPASGLGLRNMDERIEQLNGTLRIQSSEEGTLIEANVPLSHMLPPDPLSERPNTPDRGAPPSPSPTPPDARKASA